MAGWIFAVRVVVIQAFHSLFLQRKTPSTDARVREIGKLWGQLSYAYYFTDSFRALVTHLRHMNFLESHYLKDQLAQAYANHGPAAAIINWYSRALKYGFKSLALRQELDDRWGTARSRTYLAVTLGSSGAWAAGLEQGLLAESEFAKIGDRSELIILRINIAYQYMLLGQWDKAEYYAHRAAQVAKEFDSITGQIRAAWIRAEMGGRFDSLKLLAEIENLWSLLEPDSEAYAVSMAFNAKGRTLMHLARYQDAEEIFGQGIEHLRSNRLRADYLMALYIGHAEASLATWDLLEQGPNKDLNQVQVANAIRLAQVMTKGYVNYKAGRLRLRAAWAHRQGKFAKAQKLWRKALQVTIDQNYRYQQALVLRDWGHALLGSDKLQAECLFAQALDLLHSLRAKEETQSLAPLVPSHFKKNQSLEAMQVRPAQPLPFSGRLSAGSKREVEAFLRIAEAAKVATNFSEQIACILTEAMKLLAADRAMVQLTSDGGELQTLWTLDSLLGEGVTFSDYNVRAVDQAFASGASVLLNGASSARRSPRSTIAVPLVIQQSVKGVIYMDSAIGSGLFSEDDVQTLTIVANQIAIALETSRAVRNEAEVLHMSKDLELTGVVQRLFLPEMNHCKTAHWELATFHRTATQSGGDWWWYKSEADETLKMIVGDVTGHGAAPAMVTASLASMVRALSESQPVTTLDNVLITVNQNLVEMLRGEYLVAATAIEYKAGHLRLALAASPPVFLLRNSGQVEALTQPGAPLGDVNFLPQFSDYTIQPGDRLLIFTDGVTEMETKRGSFLGDRALLRIFQLQRGEEVEQAVTKIMETLLQRRESTPLRDDMTMVMVEFK
jgi:serine phosphatase RsbU (regulator of sigma subunit)/tetratricopeptide (TPR) repeat protein